MWVIHKRRFEETKGCMLLKCGHAAKDAAFVVEVRETPLPGLFYVGAGCVHEISQMIQDWLSEGSCLRNVGVYAGIFVCHQVNLKDYKFTKLKE